MNSIQFKTNELLMFHSGEPIGRPIGRSFGKPIGEPARLGQVFLKPTILNPLSLYLDMA